MIYLSTTDETFDSPGKTPTKSGLSFHKSRSTSSFILSAPHSGASRQAEKSEKILTYAELRNPESRSGLAGRISSVERRSGYIILVVYIYTWIVLTCRTNSLQLQNSCILSLMNGICCYKVLKTYSWIGLNLYTGMYMYQEDVYQGTTWDCAHILHVVVNNTRHRKH